MSEFSLDRNAFVILDVSTRANKAQILEAHDDKMFDGADEGVLGNARSRLTIARDRLLEEITFLPELSPNKARDVVRSLHSDVDIDRALDASRELPNLSRVNALAHLLGNATISENLLRAAIEASAIFDPSAARREIENSRVAAGFGQVTDRAWKEALTFLQHRFADVLSQAVARHDAGSAILTRSLEHAWDSSPSPWHRGFLDEVVNRYDRSTQSHLGKISEDLDAAIADVRQNPDSATALAEVVERLADWDALSQPVQLRDQAKGLDEPRSKEVGNKVRNLALWLAMDMGRPKAARKLSLALEQHFPELPTFSEQIARDIETLDDWVESARQDEILAPLVEIAQQSRERLADFASGVLSGHFSETGNGLPGSLYREFEEICRRKDELQDPALPWKIVRSIAVALNNEVDRPEAARIVTERIFSNAPPDIRPQLAQDLAAVKALASQKNLQVALEASDWDAAEKLLDEIISAAPQEERSSFQRLKQTVAQRRASRNFKRFGWGVAALVLVGVMISENKGFETRQRSTSSTDWSSYDDGASAIESSDEVEEEVASEDADDQGEEPPPPSTYGALSIAQLRYCIFEKERMEVMDRIVPPAAYSQFNDRVRDFNSRCGSAQYRYSDKSQIESEVLGRRSAIEAEARAIVAGWVPAVPDIADPYAPPTSPFSPQTPSADPDYGDQGLPGDNSEGSSIFQDGNSNE